MSLFVSFFITNLQVRPCVRSGRVTTQFIYINVIKSRFACVIVALSGIFCYHQRSKRLIPTAFSRLWVRTNGITESDPDA